MQRKGLLLRTEEFGGNDQATKGLLLFLLLLTFEFGGASSFPKSTRKIDDCSALFILSEIAGTRGLCLECILLFGTSVEPISRRWGREMCRIFVAVALSFLQS